MYYFLFSILIAMGTSYQYKATDRQPAVAGSFYPADRKELTEELTQLFSAAKKNPTQGVRAIIAPHAGYIFSGKIAASAFASIPDDAAYKNIFVIGSSHQMAFDGASVYYSGDYITPLGTLTVNKEIAGILRKSKVFDFPEDAHRAEHSIEVQLPFIQYHLKKLPPIVPIILGTDDIRTIKQIAEALKPWFKPENLFVISSDFSHYPAYDDAVTNDRSTARAILSNDPDRFIKTLDENARKHVKGLLTSMCGWTSGLTLLYLTEKNQDLKYNLIDYANSGDTPIYGEKDRVVGYNAISLTGKDVQVQDEFSFSDEEKDQLFTLARKAVESKLFGNNIQQVPDEKILPKLKGNYGVFVTLKINGDLRGCIGRFISNDPLYQLVKASALSSAFEDPRFHPLSKEEYPRTAFEITVLGPLRKIKDISEIKLGKHGILIKKDFRQGTMLPQVATENGWSVEEFLGYTSRDKAGLGWYGWKDAEIYVYDGLVLNENRK